MSDIDPVRWDRVAGYAACATGRAMAVNRFLLREAVAELSDAEAVLAEFEAHADQLDRLNDRIRHAARRLVQKQATSNRPLTADARAAILEDPTE